MRVIANLSDQIEEELTDAEKYIYCANKVRDEFPQLAETYFKLAQEEMKHMNLLHDEVVKIINNVRKEKEVPAGMQVVYDYLHEKHIKRASEIKYKIESFK